MKNPGFTVFNISPDPNNSSKLSNADQIRSFADSASPVAPAVDICTPEVMIIKTQIIPIIDAPYL